MQSTKMFLDRHWDRQSPLLLGYSGGPDSKALLYSLCDACGELLHIAHVDHGWREESAREAEALRREAEKLGLLFHTVRLTPAERNREAEARDARLTYFRELFAKIPFQALLLGHQADDLAETALKRLFEGAHLPFLGGMEPVSHMGGMAVWRPFLTLRKKELLRFLEERGLTFLSDPTNRDPAYLRSRLRLELIPMLNRSFGKEIAENLVFLSNRSHELKRYLDRKIEGSTVHRGPWGAAVDCAGMDRLERRHLLQRIAGEEGISLPRTALEPLLDWVENRLPQRKIFLQSKWIAANRGWVFFLPSASGKALPEKGLIRKLTISFDAMRSNPDL